MQNEKNAVASDFIICQRCAKWQRKECKGKDLAEASKCLKYEDIGLGNI